MPSPSPHPDRSLGWIRRILPVFAPQRRVFAAAVVAGLAAVAATVAVPIVIGRGVDAAAAGADLQPWVLALAALAPTRFGLGFAYRYGLFRSAHRLDADLRNLVYERLTELSFSYWDRTQTGQVISRANSDIRSIQLLFRLRPPGGHAARDAGHGDRRDGGAVAASDPWSPWLPCRWCCSWASA